jgi:hypothetical protein
MAKVTPIQLQKALKGVKYPASKKDLQQTAQKNGGDENVRSLLDQLKDEQFNRPADVSKAVAALQ